MKKIKKIKNKIYIAMIPVAISGVVLTLTLGNSYFSNNSPRVRGPSQPINRLSTSPGTNNNTTLSSSTITHGSDVDQNGMIPNGANTNKPSNWSESASGIIIIKSPIANSNFSSGDELIGSAKVSQVSYTLIDDKVGVISEGNIDVVNGTFSAIINFKTFGNTGRLDVYNTEPNGREVNEVQVPINL
jgi:hypothetical protein